MAVLRIEGKEIMLPEDVVKGGHSAIRAFLAANGFPAFGEVEIKIIQAKESGATAIVVVSPRPKALGTASAPKRALCTTEEYLAEERASEERHEYIDGRIFAMAGESGAHADISVNLVGEISTQLRGTPCRVRTKDTKVHSGPTPRQPHSMEGFFSYPDLVAICGEPQYHDEYQHSRSQKPQHTLLHTCRHNQSGR